MHMFTMFILSLLLAAGAPSAPSAIEITAVPSTFSPATIVLHAGQTTHLRFVHTSGVHSIASQDLDIPNTVLESGKTTDVAVTPQKPGTYVIRCETYCGPNHDTMTLTVKVEA